MFEWSNWWGTLAAVGIVILVNAALAVILLAVKATVGKRVSWLGPLITTVLPRAQLFVLLVGLWIALGMTAPSAYPWWPMVSHIFLIAVVLGGALVISGLTTFGFTSAIGRFSTDELDVPHIRRMQTQLKLIRRLVNAVIAVIALGVVLFSFPEVRAVGTSVLASAGILSFVAGLAAQSTLGNLVAGIQLVFSNAIRVGDVVVVEGEYGNIGEITLTYVVVYVWDERRLILPSTYFTNEPFEIWTRNSSLITGTVYLDVDWRVPLAQVRAKFMEVVTKATELWDGRKAGLLVTDAQGGSVTIRFTVSAADADKVWTLRCLVREEMVTWLQQTHPEALPTTRVLVPSAETAGASKPKPSSKSN